MEMVLEQVLTIIFALAVGAAVIVYAARPRHRGASISVGPSAVGSFAPAEIVQAASMPQVTAVETPAVETFSHEVQTMEVAPVVADVAAAGTVEVAPVAAPMANPTTAAAAPIAETVEIPAHRAATTHRAQRKRSTSTKSRARSSSRTKKS